MALKKPTKEEIQRSIMEILERKNTDKIPVFLDLVGCYMSLYDIKEKLRKDVKHRGTKVEIEMSTKVKKLITNESVKDLIDVQNQMLTVLDKLGIKPSDCVGGAGIDDDM